MSQTICPSCGFDLERAAPVERDGWRLTPETAEFEGCEIELSPAQVHVLYSLARNGERWLHGDVLGARVSESEDFAGNIVAIHVHRIRKRLGCLAPVESHNRRGYRWRTA